MTTAHTGRARDHVKQRTVQTTTLEIERPANFARLEEQFRVERYVLPDELRHSGQNRSVIFGHVHTALRNQLECAYKSFKYDMLDGKQCWVVYALFPHDAQPTPVTLPWTRASGELPHRSVSFADVPFHITLKLLQISLFRGTTSARFVGQDDCYTYAGPDGPNFHACVRIELTGARHARETDPVQEFRVIPHATRFGPADLSKIRPWDALYGKRAVDNRFYFLHLKTGQAEREQIVYRIVRLPNRRVRVKYHDPRNLDAGRGKILDDFIREYLAYLGNLGIIGAPRRRVLTHFKAPGGLELDFSQFGPVGVYDNRLARDSHSLSAYVELFARLRRDVPFVPVNDLVNAPAGGVLVLLDAGPADFAEGGVLEGREDPYLRLYRDTPEIPKQSLVVNMNDPNTLAGRDYLEYPFPGLQHAHDLDLQLEVALNELYLKCAVVREHASAPLPLGQGERAFVRRHTYDGETYTTALWFSNQRLQFSDLSDPAARERFMAMTAHWGVDYVARFEEFLDLRRRKDEPPEYDLIVGPDLFVVIEDLEERVLYAYAEIERRRRERSALRPIDEFKLGPHYDAIKGDNMCSLAELMGMADKGLSLSGAATTTPSVTLARSRAFYQQLLEFDQLLDDIAVTHPTISFTELTGAAWMGVIARIFNGSQRDDKPSRRVLLKKYRKLNRFLSDRGDDVQLSQGIWHDEAGAFVVGGMTPMNIGGQENAQLIRRFRVLQGHGHFECEEYLAAMAVQFVRFRQYTVLPYYFHLIDLYVENVSRYAVDSPRDIGA